MKTEEEIRKALKRATNRIDYFTRQGKYISVAHYEGQEKILKWVLGEGEK